MFKSRILIATVGLLLIMSAACDDDIKRGINPGDTTNVRLSMGETQTIQPYGIDLTFNRVVADTRCPANAYCDWSGFAEINMYFEGTTRSFNLLTYADMNEPCLPTTKRDAAGVRLELVSLSPYPDGNPTPDSEYVAVIRIHDIDTALTNPHDVIMCDLQREQVEIQGLFDIDRLRIERGQLRFTATYGGGCSHHKFYLYASPSPLAVFPPIVNLYLRHFSEPDYCDALVPVDLGYNLRPIRQAMPTFTSDPLPIQLNLHHPLDTMVYSLVWTPLDTVRQEMMPMAIGNYWIYADTIWTTNSTRTSWDTIAVIDHYRDSTGFWWVLNQSLLRLGDTIMVRNDSIFSRQYGWSPTAWPSAEYIPSHGLEPFEYSVLLGDIAFHRQVRTLARRIDVPAGSFFGVYEYTPVYGGGEPYFQHLLAPGVGFVYRNDHLPLVYPDTVSYHRSWLVDYHLQPVVIDCMPEVE